MNKYQYALFDMDGTIADTDSMIIKTMHILYDKYRGGVYTPVEQIYYFSGPPIGETIAKEFPNMDQNFLVNEFINISKDLYPQCVSTYPNCRNTLLALKEKGLKLAVVTSKRHDTTIYCLKIIGLDDLFDVVVGYDDVKNSKPSGEGIKKALKQLGAKDLQSSIYIGDNKIDLMAANDAGIDCALVCWGPRILPEELKPTYKISDFMQLRRIILDEQI